MGSRSGPPARRAGARRAGSQGRPGQVASQKVDSACCCSFTMPRPASAPPGRPRSPAAVPGPGQPRAAQTRGPAQCLRAPRPTLSVSEPARPITVENGQRRIEGRWVIGEVGLGFIESQGALRGA